METKTLIENIAAGKNTKALLNKGISQNSELCLRLEHRLNELIQAGYIGVAEIFQYDTVVPYYFLTQRGSDYLEIKHKIIV